MRWIKDTLQVIVLFLTAVTLVFVIVWGMRIESALDELHKKTTPEVPAPVEPVPGPEPTYSY